VSRALVSLLERGSSHYTWVAATTSWQTAASIELASGEPVMDIGGFSGTDNMTLARFERLVAEGKLHYYVSGGGFGGANGLGSGRTGFGGRDGPESPRVPRGGFRGGDFPGGGFGGGAGSGRTVASQIQSWVESHFKSTTVGGTTVYDLTQPKAG
jgi:hypothetical protein